MSVVKTPEICSRSMLASIWVPVKFVGIANKRLNTAFFVYTEKIRNPIDCAT